MDKINLYESGPNWFLHRALELRPKYPCIFFISE